MVQLVQCWYSPYIIDCYTIRVPELRIFNLSRKILKEEPIDGLQSHDRVDLTHIVVATAYVVLRHALEKIRIPERHLPGLHVSKFVVHVAGEISSKPMPVRQILVQPQNSQARRDASKQRIEP